MSSAPPPLPAEEKIPAAIKVFGILKICFGVLGVLMGAQGMIETPEVRAIIEETPRFAELSSPGIQVPGIVISLGFVVVGIALLKTRWWSRNAANGVTVISFLWGIGSNILITPILIDSLAQAQEGITKAGVIGGIVGVVIGGIVSLVYAVMALIYLNRWNVRHFLEKRKSVSGEN